MLQIVQLQNCIQKHANGKKTAIHQKAKSVNGRITANYFFFFQKKKSKIFQNYSSLISFLSVLEREEHET